MPGVIHTVRAQLDRASVRQIYGEITAVGDAIASEIQARLDGLEGNEAGKKAAEETLRAMKAAFDADLQALNLQVERGFMKPEVFERKAVGIAQRFNNAITAEIARLGTDPSFSVNPFAGIKVDRDDLNRLNAEGKRLGDAWVEGVVEGASDVELPEVPVPPTPDPVKVPITPEIVAPKLAEEVTEALRKVEGEIRARAGAVVGEFVTALGSSKLGAAGTQKAAEFLEAMRAELGRRLAALRKQVEDGIVDPVDFPAKAAQIATVFADRLREGIDAVRAGEPDFGEAIAAAGGAGALAAQIFDERLAQAAPGEALRASIMAIEGDIRTRLLAPVAAFDTAIRDAKLGPAGTQKASEFLDALRLEFERRMAAIRKQVEDGILDEPGFRAKADRLALAFTARLEAGTANVKVGDPDFSGAVTAAGSAGEAASRAFDEALAALPPEVPVPDTRRAESGAREAGDRVGDRLKEGIEDADVPRTAEDAAREAAKAFVDRITADTRRRRQEVKLAQMEGFLTEAEAAAEGDKITRAHNRAILDGIRTFRSEGRFTPEVLSVFTGAFEEVEKNVPPESFWTRLTSKIRTRLAMIGTSIVGFFTLRALGRFASSAFSEAVEDESAFAALSAQIDATGASFDRLAPRIDRVARSFADRGIASTGRFARGLSELIAVSGNAEKSLANMGLVADFARKHHITFEQSVDLVGRAMVGQVTTLKRYGIAVKEGDDAVLAMAKSLDGFNRDQAPTMRDRLNAAAIAWSDLKGAIGETLLEAGGGASAIDMITTALRDGTRFVREHKEEFAALARTLADLVSFLLRDGLRGILDFADRTRIEVANIRRFFLSLGAGIRELLASLKDLAAGFEDALSAMYRFFRNQGAADQARAYAEAYREQARELRRVAEANREAAKSERERAEAAREALRARATGTAGTHGAADRAMSRMMGGRPEEGTDDEEPGGAVKRVGEDRDKANDVLDRRIQLLTKALGFERTRMEALAELGRIEVQVQRALAASNLSLDKRIDLEEKLAAIEKAREGLLKPIEGVLPPERLGTKVQVRRGEPGEDLTVGPPIMPRAPTKEETRVFNENMKEVLHDEIKQMVKEIGEESPPIQLSFADDLIFTFFSNLETFADNAATGIVETFEDVFSRIGSEAMSVNEILGQLGKGMAKSILREIAAMAKGKAIENVAVAIEETAKGFAALASFNPASASLHFKAAGTAALAAVKWGLVAGGVGALAGGGGGGGGGGGASREGEESDPLRNRRQTVTFFIKGGLLNTDDPAQMDALAAGIAAVSDKDIVVRRG